MKIKQIKINYGLLVCIILAVTQFIASFFYTERVFTNESMDHLTLANYSNLDHIIFYSYTKILSFCAILALWMFLYWSVKNIKRKLYFWIPFIVMSVDTLYKLVLQYPTIWTTDYAPMYSLTIRYLPDYWQHFLTNVVYAVCMHVFPHNIAPSALKGLVCCGILAYLFYKLQEIFPKTGYKYLVFLLYLLPQTLYICGPLHRNLYYTLVLVLFFMILIFEKLEKGKCTIKKLILYGIFTALLATWRSEGIILLFFIPVLLLMVYYEKGKMKKWILTYLISLASFYLVFSVPQKMGMAEQFGKDYLIINFTNGPLPAVFNTSYANLSYEGAEEDLANIDKIVPIDYIKQFTIFSFQHYNCDSGRNISQTLSTSEDQSAFVKSALSICAHNWKIVLKERINCFVGALGEESYYPLPSSTYCGIEGTSLASFRETIAFGTTEAYSSGMEFWNSDKVVAATDELERKIQYSLLDSFTNATSIFMLGYIVWLFLYTFVKKNWFWCLIALMEIGQLTIIFLLEPGAYPIYILPMKYLCLVVFIIRINIRLNERRCINEG